MQLIGFDLLVGVVQQLNFILEHRFRLLIIQFIQKSQNLFLFEDFSIDREFPIKHQIDLMSFLHFHQYCQFGCHFDLRCLNCCI
jgi:hypothetical protein